MITVEVPVLHIPAMPGCNICIGARIALSALGAAVNSVQNPAYDAGLEARFARAARHSRMVRILRIAVPAAVVLSMAAVVAVSIFNPFRMLLPKLPLDMGNLVVSGTKITMESPHLAGFTTDQRPYELWAKTATQDMTDPDHVELKTLRAKVLMEDKSTLTLDARTGCSTASSNCSTCARISSCDPPPATRRGFRRPMSTSTRARSPRTSMSTSNC